MLPELTATENLPVLGPIVGGYLFRPAVQYPRIFGDFQFFKTYPYFLPCAIPPMFCAIAWVAVFYLLKETVKSPVPISHIFRVKSQQREASRGTPLRLVLNSRVIISVGHYAFVALIEVAYRAIQPLFFATPIDFGGLGLSPPSIGNLLAGAGALTGILQLLFFSSIHRRWGTKATFLNGLIGSLPMFFTFPIAHLLVGMYGFNRLLWVFIVLQSIMSFGYGLSFGKRVHFNSYF
ncbi:hypothetical protein C0989_010989 [Termitomyces sp. Mn162]|nr:hypothetical protein C0989_010989 [Termitomyces sp. Mn162]